MISDRLLMNSVNQHLTKVCNLNTNKNYSFYVSTLRIQSIIFISRCTRLVPTIYSMYVLQCILCIAYLLDRHNN